MKIAKFVVSLIVTTGLFVLLHFSHGRLPPLGNLLNPFTGFWRNNRAVDRLPESLYLSGLEENVTVVFDDRRVPHIFAKNTHDLYMAQGFLTARERLWQMDMQTRYAAGRLAEIMGSEWVESDRFQRRIGMAFAAENALEKGMRDPESRQVLEAYTEGVNAYIRSLRPGRLPLEYKLMDFKPEPWTPIRSVYLLKYMAWDLSGFNEEIVMTRSRRVMDDENFRRLYPPFPPYLETIVPSGTKWPFKPDIAPGPMDAAFPITKAHPIGIRESIPGSNNWAVSGAKTESGFPILCNDPHLGLGLPSVWYENHLHAPGVNVYGVSLPAAPGVIIGFNERVAWGMTTAMSDVLDWYRITFKDESRREYLYDGEWRSTARRVEKIRVKGSSTIIDTVLYTHHGPVAYLPGEKPYSPRVPQNAAMRWTGHDPSNELQTILMLNRAADYDDFVEAISHYDCPGQNIVFADVTGDIAIWHCGKLPVRWKGQGVTISEGTDPAYEWQGWIPREHLPHVKNPAQNFVASANNHAADSGYPYFLGMDFASSARACRIREVLSAGGKFTPEHMMALQNDVLDVQARRCLPLLIESVSGIAMNAAEKTAFEILQAWNYEYRAELIAPTVYDSWWRTLYRLVWSDEMEHPEGSLNWPGVDLTVYLILNEPEFSCFDDKRTEKKETRQDVIVSSFRLACRDLTERWGDPVETWAWGRTRGTDLMHLSRIPGFGVEGLSTHGGSYCVNKTTRTHGPSWRMIVRLGPEIRAWAVYPGGQSGHPGSEYYDDGIEDWVEGRVAALPFLESPDEAAAESFERLILRGDR